MNLFSVSGKNWIFKEFNSSDVNKFLEDFSITQIVAKLLSIRKKNIDDIRQFLDPKIKNLLPNPSHLKDMKSAIDRTYKSILKDELIGIFGDYDVDGASSAALLARYFLSINVILQLVFETLYLNQKKTAFFIYYHFIFLVCKSGCETKQCHTKD